MPTRSVLTVLAITAACITRPAHAQHPVFGQWRVTRSICAPGGCALSHAEAASWRGRIATYSDTLARFAEHSCLRPRYAVTYWPANGLYGGASFADLGLRGDSAMIVVISCPGQPPTGLLEDRWEVAGGFLIVRNADHLLAIWEGVFFELTRQ
jgi:hypothetical protein